MWMAAAGRERGGTQLSVSSHSWRSVVHAPQVRSWSQAFSLASRASVEVAGGVVVVAGLQQLLDVLDAGLRPDRYPPPPVGRRPAVRGDQRRRRAGAVLERCGGPPVHHPVWRVLGTGGFRGGGRGGQAQPGQQAQRPAALPGERDRRAGQLVHVAVVPVQRLGVQAEVFG